MRFDYRIDVLYNLLKTISAKYDGILNISEGFNEHTSSRRIVLLRHDVDKNPENALRVARMEHKLGIHGTYYFRIHPSVFKKEIIREIYTLGHEIGYHYEDYTKYHGNHEKAIISFRDNLAEIRKLVPVKTICMDGRPLSKYNNLDLWKYHDYRQYGILAEPFLDINFGKVLYLTDTGRGWNMVKYSVRDKVNENFHYHNISTAQLIRDISAGKLPDQIMLNIHPQRWHNNTILWAKELFLQRFKNVIKWGLIKIRREDINQWKSSDSLKHR